MKFTLSIKRPWFGEEIAVQVKYPRSESVQPGIVEVIRDLQQLSEVADPLTLVHLGGVIKDLTTRSLEAREISYALNGPGHAALSGEAQRDLISRHRELLPHLHKG